MVIITFHLKNMLEKINCLKIKQIWSEAVVFDIPINNVIKLSETKHRQENLIPKFKNIKSEEAMLEYYKPDLEDAQNVFYQRQCHLYLLMIMEFVTIV